MAAWTFVQPTPQNCIQAHLCLNSTTICAKQAFIAYIHGFGPVSSKIFDAVATCLWIPLHSSGLKLEHHCLSFIDSPFKLIKLSIKFISQVLLLHIFVDITLHSWICVWNNRVCTHYQIPLISHFVPYNTTKMHTNWFFCHHIESLGSIHPMHPAEPMWWRWHRENIDFDPISLLMQTNPKIMTATSILYRDKDILYHSDTTNDV